MNELFYRGNDMKTLKNGVLGAIALLLFTAVVQAETINIYTGKGVNTNTVNEGRVVINGKVIKGSSRKMTAKEQKQLTEELNQQGADIEKDMVDMQKQLEGMFD